MTDLGTFGGIYSIAWGINDSGEVVGRANLTTGAQHAFLYSNGTMTDLNTLISQSSGWTLEDARDINDNGWIVGYGNYINWGDGARFCNWLNNGQPTGPEGNGTTETGAYTLNGDTTNLLTEIRNAGAKYVIPTENEWYKAAYYDPSNGTYWIYPTQSNTAPSNVLSAMGTNNANYMVWNGSEYVYTDPTNYLTSVGSFSSTTSPYGAYDMGGDVVQWDETAGSWSRGLRGGTFYNIYQSLASSFRGNNIPTADNYGYGFRVASEAVPEPGSITLLVAGAIVAWICWRRR